MKHSFPAILGVAMVVASCGGGGGDPVLVAASDTSLPTNATIAGAVAGTPFAFPSGVPTFGTTAATTVAFTGTGTSPAFSIGSGGNTATGATNFGSCIFAITNSTFPAGHPLAQGQTLTVNPCNVNFGTAGAVANGVAQSRSIALLLGAASSAAATITVGVNPGGQLTVNGNSVGTVTLTPVSG